jgi:glycosyltransferase involved in cell wall biosynthesis
VQLDAYSRLDDLRASRDSELKRFRRLHRLAGPLVLYAGPYEPVGGLDVAIAAFKLVREGHDDLRFAAIPEGRVDKRYLGRCEGDALSLGHHGIVEWNPSTAERTLWYAFAEVVCVPCRASGIGRPAQLAAAAARPLVGSRVDSLVELVQDGVTGLLVPGGDAESLAAALHALLQDSEKRRQLGDQARRRAEAEWSPDASAQRLHTLWLEVAQRTMQHP